MTNARLSHAMTRTSGPIRSPGADARPATADAGRGRPAPRLVRRAGQSHGTDPIRGTECRQATVLKASRWADDRSGPATAVVLMAQACRHSPQERSPGVQFGVQSERNRAQLRTTETATER